MAANDSCLVCNELLPEIGTYPMCCECGYGYHLGSCSGVFKTAFKSKSIADRKEWTCQTCVILSARGTASPRKEKPEKEPAFQDVLLQINKKLAEITEIKAKVGALLQIKETVDRMEHSVQHMSEKYDEVLVEMKQQSAEIAALQKRVEKVEATNTGQEVQELRQELNSLEQYTRRQNLEIHGLKHDSNEDLLGKLNALENELKLPLLSEHELDGLHRLPEKKGKSPAVLVRFVSRKDLTLADMLSRATPAECGDTSDFGDIQVHAVDVLSFLDGRSPAELLQGRRLRTRLPDFSQESKPPVKKPQQQSSGRPLHQLQPGQIVRVRGQAWTQKAKVVEKVAPRSYNIAT
ncbi:uncharacterized protein LOC144119310 [Amblyomma americanum]